MVELVVSNGFAPQDDAARGARPTAPPQANFQTQVYRWVFHYAPGGDCGCR